MVGDRDQGVAGDNRELGQWPDKGEGCTTGDGEQDVVLARINGSPGTERAIPGSGRTGSGRTADLGEGGWEPWDGDPSVTAGSAKTGDRGVAGTVPRTQPGPLRRRGRAVAAAAPGLPLPHRPAFVCGCGGALPHSG